MLIRAWRGEFGLRLRYFVPQVYALGRGHTIEIERGEEALFPLADEWRIVERAPDGSRHGRPPRIGRELRFVPEPHVPQDIRADIVICPRLRTYGEAKNWPHWHRLAELPGVFAAGAPDSSFNVKCERAWDYDRFLDASIEAMRSARLVIATDAGLAHLAVLCGAPLLLITHEGRVAPGPVISSSGRTAQRQYWPVRLDEYYHAANHMSAPIDTVDGWNDPDAVLRAAMAAV